MIAIHINPNIENQVNYGSALSDGFKAHGIKHNLTSDIHVAGDIHCIIGPWYAFQHYKSHEKVLYLDRACWDHPTYTCINWMNKGEKVWNWKTGKQSRFHPEIKPWKTGERLLILCDYGEDGLKYADRIKLHYDYEIRRHPEDIKPEQGLMEALSDFSMAYGGKSTALVTAAIEGLIVFNDDKLSPVYPVSSSTPLIDRPNRHSWLSDLSWHNWNIDEISSGEAWQWFAKG